MKTNTTATVFNFERDELNRHIEYEMRLLDKIGHSFNYVFDKLVALKHYKIVGKGKPNLSKCNWNEGKNYDWLAVSGGKDVRILLRRYQTHFTVYTSLTKKNFNKKGELIYTEKRFGNFSYHSDVKKNATKTTEDFYWDNHCVDLNDNIHGIIDLIRKDHVHSVWNSYSLPRPEWVDIKLMYCGTSIHSVDGLIFACEELSQINLGLFAENEMLEKVRTMSVGDKIGDKKITRVDKVVKDGYYHGVGVLLGKDYEDVYALTHWHLAEIFPELIEADRNL